MGLRRGGGAEGRRGGGGGVEFITLFINLGVIYLD